MFIDENKIENTFGTYIRGKKESIPIPEIAPFIDNYKKNIAQRFYPRRFEKIPKIKGEVLYISVKVDGEYACFYYSENISQSFFCNSPTHRIYAGLPVNNDLEKIMKSQGIESALIGGELYATPHDPLDFEARCRVPDFVHFSRQPKTLEDLERIGFKAFDIIQINGMDWTNKTYSERFKKLNEIFPKKGRASIVHTKIVTRTSDIEDFYNDKVIDHGMEGIVVRTEGVGFKIKPVNTIDVAIIGISAGLYGTKYTKDQLATALVALRNPGGDYQILTAVGGGLTDQERYDLWKIFEIIPSKGFVVPNRYDGTAFQMVKPGIVGQIDYMDILTERQNEPILQNTLRFNTKEERWESLKPVDFVTLISPRFVKGQPIREDKDANVIEDVRVTQITDVVDVPTFKDISEIEFNKSKILARKVFIKERQMIRKFIAWKTNKENTGLYPKYAVYFLDYSINRKNPLNRRAKIFNNEDTMWKFFDSWVDSEMLSPNGNMKRDWKEYSIQDTRFNDD
jgi:hypothetical protein